MNFLRVSRSRVVSMLDVYMRDVLKDGEGIRKGERSKEKVRVTVRATVEQARARFRPNMALEYKYLATRYSIYVYVRPHGPTRS